MKRLQIVTADGVPLAAHWEQSARTEGRGVVLIAPATGERRQFYSE